MPSYPKPTIFGIRHHGPGSARSLLQALEVMRPDAILIEGPPDADALIPLLAHPEMQPPIALLVYVPDEPKFAAYYPFASFSPEYQAIQFALAHDIPVRFMDLPATYVMRVQKDRIEAEQQAAEEATPDEETASQPEGTPELDAETKLRHDPLGQLAQAAGYPDGERWWEQMVEQRQDSTGLFEALLEAMTALRDDGLISELPLEAQREAYMRKIIRETQKEGYQRIAAVCGAWHAPALEQMPMAKHDRDILKGMKRIKVEATYTPWTHGRLTMVSGYGAGIWSPGWYQHLWESNNENIAISWLTKCASLLRDEDLSASPAQVIDAVRLAEALAALRNRSMPGLEEFNEAALTVFCFGNRAPLRLIHDKLIVGEVMGGVPDETPMLPLQRDLQQQQKTLRMHVTAVESELKLDLRNDFHLRRSHLLHRLEILEIYWGKKTEVTGKTGTFHEVWKLKWFPEMTIQIIEKSAWGNTVKVASTAYAKHVADTVDELPQLTQLVNDVLLADLPDAVGHVVKRLQVEASSTGDIKQLMAALPALADVMVYGNVRQTDADMVANVVEGMVTRICIGLPAECVMLDDEAAQEMFLAFLRFNSALNLLNNYEYIEQWHSVLMLVVEQWQAHGLLRGRGCRILFDDGAIAREEAIRQMRLTMSLVESPVVSAAWLMGFLHNSGLILIHDETLLTIIDAWLSGLKDADFEAMLPLMRRTFSTFSEPECRQIGLIVSGRTEENTTSQSGTVDEDRANLMLPILAELLGVDNWEATE